MNTTDFQDLYVANYFDNPDVVHRHMEKSILNRTPRSFIRLSDGEAKILAYPGFISFEKVCVQMKIWFGDVDYDEFDILQIKSDLIEAIKFADYLGVPTQERCDAKTDSEYTNDAYLCRSMWQVLIEELGEGYLNSVHIVPATYHQWMQLERKLSGILTLNKNIGMISRTEKALFRLHEFIDIEACFHLKVPGETWSRPDSKVSDHYPLFYKKIRRTIRDMRMDDSLVLVGAGVLGKIYCSDIKRRGGFAFDVGALIDGWSDSIPEVRKGMSTKSSKMKLDYLFEINEVK